MRSVFTKKEIVELAESYDLVIDCNSLGDLLTTTVQINDDWIEIYFSRNGNYKWCCDTDEEIQVNCKLPLPQITKFIKFVKELRNIKE